ncbi:MAG TPA: hypothetical protein VF297_00775 [Pyrinomonadaceae bacterium]
MDSLHLHAPFVRDRYRVGVLARCFRERDLQRFAFGHRVLPRAFVFGLTKAHDAGAGGVLAHVVIIERAAVSNHRVGVGIFYGL